MKRRVLEERRNKNRTHTQLRFLQRFNFVLTNEDYTKLYRAIRDRYKGIKIEGVDVEWVGTMSLTRVIYKIGFKGISAFVVYNKLRKRIISVWPKNPWVHPLRAVNRKYAGKRTK
jgi:hypothetical protein